jgi:hypothetical protein
MRVLQLKASRQMTIQVLSPEPIDSNLVTPIFEFNSVSVFCGTKPFSQIGDVKLTD